RQDIDVVVIDAFPILVDRNAQSPTYFLSPANFRTTDFFKKADLKHIRIIPAFFEGGMGKDKTYRTGETQQSLLVLHNQLIGVLIGFDISGCIPEILKLLFFVRSFGFLIGRKITFVYITHFYILVTNLIEDGLIFL